MAYLIIEEDLKKKTPEYIDESLFLPNRNGANSILLTPFLVEVEIVIAPL